MPQSPIDNQILLAKEMPWPEETEDLKNCEGIVFMDHPDGVLGPLIQLPEGLPEDLDENTELRFVINPTVIKIVNYFHNKYGVGNGKLLFAKYKFKHWVKEPGF